MRHLDYLPHRSPLRRVEADAVEVPYPVHPDGESTGKHSLIDKAGEDRCRWMGEKPVPAAVLLTARNAAGDKRHFRADGVEYESVDVGLGEIPTEPHPNMTIEVFGKTVALHRYSLHWLPSVIDLRSFVLIAPVAA